MNKFIYFIQCGTQGPIKIGFTKDILKRMQTLQTANHEKLHIIGMIAGSEQEEVVLHQKFAPLVIRGEWFQPNSTLLEYIHSLPLGLLENYKIAVNQCRCGNGVDHLKYQDGSFTASCHRCLMIEDGRLSKLKEARDKHNNKPAKEEEQCKVCNQLELYLRHGRCSTCAAYYRRKGHDRPSELMQPKLTSCIECSKEQKQLTRKRCHRCYYKWKKMNHATS